MQNLTKRQATAALRAVCAYLGVAPTDLEAHTQGDGTQWHVSGAPTLVRDWDYAGARWSIVWEEGPYDWAVLASGEGLRTPGTFLEPINGWALGLYPA